MPSRTDARRCQSHGTAANDWSAGCPPAPPRPAQMNVPSQDLTRIVNHKLVPAVGSAKLTYLEEGRDAFYVQALGRDPHYVVARVEIDLRAEVRYTDRQLRVRIAVERVGTTSLTTRETILTPAGMSAAEARVITVLWDTSGGKPVAFAADDHARLAALPPSAGDIAAVRGRQARQPWSAVA